MNADDTDPDGELLAPRFARATTPAEGRRASSVQIRAIGGISGPSVIRGIRAIRGEIVNPCNRRHPRLE